MYLIWILLLITPTLFSQSEVSIPGTYILTEKIGVHYEPGVSFGDSHYTPYISSVDTTITQTIVLDSLNKATFTRDTTLYHTSGSEKIKMTGNWSIRNDTLTIQYTHVDTIYPYNLTLKPFKGTIGGADYELIPDETAESSSLEKKISEQYTVLIYENVRYLESEENKVIEKFIDGIAPVNRTEEWIKFRKQ